MSRSTKFSLAVPNPLRELIDLQRASGIIDYPSDNAAVIGLILYQGLVGKAHTLTSRIAYMHPSQQDAIHDFVLELNQRGLSVMGSFNRRVAERVAAGESEPDPDTIVRLQADQILLWAQRSQAGDESVWAEVGAAQSTGSSA